MDSPKTKMTYSEIAKASRLKCLDLIYRAQTSHIGSVLGCADIMAVLFERINLDKDKFVLSAGWKAALLYYHLWRKGRITLEQLDSYCIGDSEFIGLAEPIIPDIPIAGGSMGLGLPGAVGLALAKKIKGEEGTVYCLMSDGELQCGTFWESWLIAKQHSLNNLTIIVEWNRLQAMGEVRDILNIDEVLDWGTYIDGHDTERLRQEIELRFVSHPRLIIAKTTKGKGWKRAEGNNLYHYKGLSEEEYLEAKAELHG